MSDFESRKIKRVYRLSPVVEAMAIAGGLALAEHIGLYRWRGSLPLVGKYIIGVSTLLLALWHACIERNDTNAAKDATLIAIASGSVVVAAHLVRKVQYERSQRGAVHRQSARR
jgi:hypothetical protein